MTNDTWNWHTWQDLPYLTCSLLEKWPHGFFTRQFSPRSPLELTDVLLAHRATSDPIAPQSPQVYRVKQVHGNIVLLTGEAKPLANPGGDTQAEGGLPEADGLLANEPAEAVWVASADCAPVLIASHVTGKVAAVHSGWRGTAAAIVPKAIARFQQLFPETSLDSMRIAIGPGIAGEVYQVSTEVAAKVCATIAPKSISEDNSILEWALSLPEPPVLPDSEPERLRLDVRRTIAMQLFHMGIEPEQVAIAPYCTYQTPDHFFSYRREHLKQIQWSGIISQ
ncbi:MAG TPA: peptidoglycan editing factor PgeF [Oscillatoriaceae cyanobacterium M33_DOE_052]|uniref:Purine nucleoside phosphorylase n=1 Tax=Planktothricoides sp. SpSt-374 TaxID=2282167 RepID=A0A7C3VR73_9CYAN|nr:peptidoglycan editing factor PgeF [Oscillatoriaceae cyanobacterium M33_DOE_052]